MNNAQSSPETISRPALIAALRDELTRRAGDMSICKLAAQTGIFCKGFRRSSEAELKERYDWIARKNPGMSREELESIADRWQLARQDVLNAESSCDVQQREHDSCGGWDDFGDDQLARFLRELTGRNVVVSH
ncbi:MAG TPA: hypothetical protein VFN10_20475 [Thermoanaerobaculia bacterium]|nr:hypothetical protein [Thermoanaerobaculia bacterium]